MGNATARFRGWAIRAKSRATPPPYAELATQAKRQLEPSESLFLRLGAAVDNYSGSAASFGQLQALSGVLVRHVDGSDLRWMDRHKLVEFCVDVLEFHRRYPDKTPAATLPSAETNGSTRCLRVVEAPV